MTWTWCWFVVKEEKCTRKKRGTPRKFNSSPLKIGNPKRKLIFQPSFFRVYVKFQGCNIYLVGGFLPPIWFYFARQIGSFPQIGMNISKKNKPPASYILQVSLLKVKGRRNWSGGVTLSPTQGMPQAGPHLRLSRKHCFHVWYEKDHCYHTKTKQIWAAFEPEILGFRWYPWYIFEMKKMEILI